MLEKIINIISEQLNVPSEELSANTALFDDLGADSLDIVEIMMKIEEEYGVKVPDEDLIEMKKIGDIAKYISSHAGKENNSAGMNV